MSQTNTRLDRDSHGRLIRRYKLKGTRMASRLAFVTPSWWVDERMNRPKRRLENQLCNKVLCGADPEGLVWPLGNHKPHDCYW